MSCSVSIGTMKKVLMLLILLHASVAEEVVPKTEEYCQSESFHPRCQKNEVILMKTATYGRMRIGRCVKVQEVTAHRSLVGDDPRYLGCSVDVLDKLDRRCSGKPECEIRVFDISDDNTQPCFPGLFVYLEASYDCINVADDQRSCVVVATKIPTHIIGSSYAQKICGTKSQPWIVEAPVGQKVKVTLLDFTDTQSKQTPRENHELCSSLGLIVDKAGKRNTSFCGNGKQREKKIHVSSGSALEIYFNPLDQKEEVPDGKNFILRFEAVGCLDIIPPEDTWLKRNDDSIVIGCYSSRQTWQLNCKEGKWTGVLGNCSQVKELIGESEFLKPTVSSDEQVLAVVAISGCTLAICLAIVCTGAICLRRFYVQIRKKQEYKTLNYHISESLSRGGQSTCRATGQQIPPPVTTDFVGNGSSQQQMPTYSVYVGTTENNGGEHLVA